MLTFILDVLTYILIGSLLISLIISVIVFFLALTWLQVTDGKENHLEQERGAQEGRSADPAAKRRGGRAACSHQRALP